MQACKLHLLPHKPDPSSPSPSSPAAVSSVLFESVSGALAVMHSDSSVLLYSSLSLPLLPSSLASASLSSTPSPVFIPPISTSACFVRLLPTPNSNRGRVLFLSAAPHASGSAVLLRCWILGWSGTLFSPARMNFKRDRDKLGLVLDLRHGFSVQLVGSVNVFVLHSAAAGKIWVFAARLVGGMVDDEGSVDLMKCAVIGCERPIYSIRVSLGFLLLGEVNGVRVFPLRPLVKGRPVNQKDLGRRKLNAKLNQSSVAKLKKDCQVKLPNGVAIGSVNWQNCEIRDYAVHLSSAGCCCQGICAGREQGDGEVFSEGFPEGKADGDSIRIKHRTIKLGQTSGDLGSFFVEINGIEGSDNAIGALASVKAISINPLTHRRFLILDSFGDIHLLSVYNTVRASEATHHSSIPSKVSHMRRLDHTMKVHMLAVLPDLSIRAQTVWISDGFHSVHMMSANEMEIPAGNDDHNGNDGNLIHLSAIQAIFTSDKIQDIIPLAANAVLILGHGNVGPGSGQSGTYIGSHHVVAVPDLLFLRQGTALQLLKSTIQCPAKFLDHNPASFARNVFLWKVHDPVNCQATMERYYIKRICRHTIN